MKTKTVEGAGLADSVAAGARWVDAVLWTGAVAVLVTLACYVTGQTEFSVLGATLSLRHGWLMFLLLTLAHLYTAALLVRGVRQFWSTASVAEGEAVFKQVTQAGGLFMRGMKPRVFGEKGDAVVVTPSDPAYWVGAAFCVLLFVAVLLPAPSLQTFVLAALIARINWIIGSQWAIALSELTIPRSQSQYLSGAADKGRRSPATLPGALAQLGGRMRPSLALGGVAYFCSWFPMAGLLGIAGMAVILVVLLGIAIYVGLHLESS